MKVKEFRLVRFVRTTDPGVRRDTPEYTRKNTFVSIP